MWLTLATACCAVALGVQALDAAAKLRFAVIVAQWGALFWIGLRVASVTLGGVV